MKLAIVCLLLWNILLTVYVGVLWMRVQHNDIYHSVREEMLMKNIHEVRDGRREGVGE